MHIAGDECMRADVALAFEHDELFLARVAVCRHYTAGTHADQARMRAGHFIAAQLANFHERRDLDPRAIVGAQRARVFGRLLARLLDDATSQSLALLETQLRAPHAGCKRVLQGLGTTAHRTSSASRRCTS